MQARLHFGVFLVFRQQYTPPFPEPQAVQQLALSNRGHPMLILHRQALLQMGYKLPASLLQLPLAPT